MDSKENPSTPGSPASADKAPVTPRLAVDVIVDMGAGLVVLVERKNEPAGWALPGGFVDVGETVEEAALRECFEETGLNVELVRQFHVYSDPKRDPTRGHTASVVFVARGWGQPKAASDAKSVGLYYDMNLPAEIAFDHRQILRDYFTNRY
jgi:8-oxo-dGTP diphosphatase